MSWEGLDRVSCKSNGRRRDKNRFGRKGRMIGAKDEDEVSNDLSMDEVLRLVCDGFSPWTRTETANSVCCKSALSREAGIIR